MREMHVFLSLATARVLHSRHAFFVAKFLVQEDISDKYLLKVIFFHVKFNVCDI
jgi:hypothetical protein